MVRVRPAIPPTRRGAIFYATGPSCPPASIETALIAPAALGQRVCGWLAVGHDQKRGDGWMVRGISVDPAKRRAGVATALYEHAARLSCLLAGGPLASDTKQKKGAKAFWQKQVDKGRAERMGKRFVLNLCSPVLSLSGSSPLPPRRKVCRPFTKQALAKGTRIERREHRLPKKFAEQIARDHLCEKPGYYRRER